MNKREAQENIKTILMQKLTLECLTLMVGGAVVSGTSAPAGMGDWEFAQVGFALIPAAAPRSISPFSARHNSAAPLSLLPPSHPASSQALLSLPTHGARSICAALAPKSPNVCSTPSRSNTLVDGGKEEEEEQEEGEEESAYC